MISKFGEKFENVSKLFYHAAHNGSNYLKGHCFVSVMLCVSVWNNSKVSYLSVPLVYRGVAENGFKTGACGFHDPSGNARLQEEKRCYHSM